MTLYIGPLATLVGRRVLVKDVHVISGLLLPAPLVVAYAGSWRAGLRRDVRRFARWSRDDRRWLTSLGRRGRARMGKFNAGQKVNAIFVAGCIPVMLATGAIMRWFDPFPLAWRTGATFVHDWLGIFLLAMVVGHIAKALADPVALQAMRRGTVPASHAQQAHPRWWRELQEPIASECAAQGVWGAATPPTDPPEGGSAVPQAAERRPKAVTDLLARRQAGDDDPREPKASTP
jgi:formate dehydrogenase subunit gamma